MNIVKINKEKDLPKYQDLFKITIVKTLSYWHGNRQMNQYPNYTHMEIWQCY